MELRCSDRVAQLWDVFGRKTFGLSIKILAVGSKREF